MHIVIVSPFPADKPKGGVESAALNLVRQLVRSGGYKITVLAPSYKGVDTAEQRDGYVLQWVPQPPLGFISYWSVLRSRVRRHLNVLKPDICHFQAMLALSYGYDEPYVATVHGIGESDIRTRGGRLSEVRARIVGWAEQRARRRLVDCIVINPYVAELLGDQLSGATLHHIGNPLDVSFFEQRGDTTRGQDVLFVAKMDRNKNLGAALEAFSSAAARLPEGAKLVVYGPVADQNYHAECLAQVSALALDERVEFVGAQPAAVIADHMRRARALILTSHHEVAPMVISEALSCGLPTVTFRKCGMQYMLEDGVTGVLVDDGDTGGLAEGLVQVSGANMHEACSQAGLSYSPQHVMEKTTELYQRVIGRAK